MSCCLFSAFSGWAHTSPPHREDAHWRLWVHKGTACLGGHSRWQTEVSAGRGVPSCPTPPLGKSPAWEGGWPAREGHVRLDLWGCGLTRPAGIYLTDPETPPPGNAREGQEPQRVSLPSPPVEALGPRSPVLLSVLQGSVLSITAAWPGVPGPSEPRPCSGRGSGDSPGWGPSTWGCCCFYAFSGSEPEPCIFFKS